MAAGPAPERTLSADGDELVEPAIALVRQWLASAEASLTRRECKQRDRFRLLTSDKASLDFTMAFCDRVIRPETDVVAAEQLRELVDNRLPSFLSWTDRLLLRAGAALSSFMPSLVMPLARRRLRQLVGSLVVDRADEELTRKLSGLRQVGFGVNTNLLGEYVLGEEEAQARLQSIIELLRRDDVDYASVKVSAVASQLNLWGYDESLSRVEDRLRLLYRAAIENDAEPKFVNLDMEEYRDLRFTVDAFKQLLDEPEFAEFPAGIALQAYLPDSFDVLIELVDWASDRSPAGSIKIRVVKGANLAMEKVDAEIHGWAQAPYETKAEVDANYKRMLDWALRPSRLRSVRIGVASHNLFDVAWARLLANQRSVADRVDFEMLQGMAVGIDRTVRDATDGVVVYTPIVAAADFDSALAYLFRRLEENSRPGNFLASMFELAGDQVAFEQERVRFVAAVAGRHHIASGPRRELPDLLVHQQTGRATFSNSADSDPTSAGIRSQIVAAVAKCELPDVPSPATDVAAINEAVGIANEAAIAWAARSSAERCDLLQTVARTLDDRRPELIAVMAAEACKTIAEGDSEVSEAIDFANYYALQFDSGSERGFQPLGTILVTPPWNFPLAIPAGGVLAALAAGNTVILKPAPQTPATAYALAQACWDAGVGRDVVQYLRCNDELGSHLVAHPGVSGIILTGAAETAELFRQLAPNTPLFAETSGKNAIVVLPDADLDLAAADLMKSAFGHAGQKCSAASIGILVGDVYGSEKFRRQLVDAARSLVLGEARQPATTLAPLIAEPTEKLQRALETLDPGERWLLKPEVVDKAANLWSPGIKDGVTAGSWFHQTECFGPVLGLMHAADLDQAIDFQNGNAFGLTGGIHTLDPDSIEHWVERVEVGNVYVNRGITGAIVARQPFGGWKRSAVGPGAKAGGPNYVGQLGHWTDSGPLARSSNETEPTPELLAFVESHDRDLSPEERNWLDQALASDAYWQTHEFGVMHDPAGLASEANWFRYRPAAPMIIRIEPAAKPAEVLRVLACAQLAGTQFEVSIAPDLRLPSIVLAGRKESADDLLERVNQDPIERVRLLGECPTAFARLGYACFLDDRPVLADGRIEGLRYRREQSISQTMHRFGNLLHGRDRGGG